MKCSVYVKINGTMKKRWMVKNSENFDMIWKVKISCRIRLMKPIYNESSKDWMGRENKPFFSQKMTECTNKVIV